MMVNNKWATNCCIRERVSTRSFEILTGSFRPHYLPRELGQVTVILVYIPGPDYTGAAERVAECYNRTINRSIIIIIISFIHTDEKFIQYTI